MTPRACPVCASADVEITVRRDRLPVFQNVVYATPQAAQQAPQAELALGTCRVCGFSYNSAFDEALVVYDENYDNHVASAVFKDYYRQLAQMLIDRLGLRDGTVYDIGCGNGEFLRILCELAPGIRGVGVDPSCTPTREGNFELIRAFFDRSLFQTDAKLVILRHVLEHIGEPVSFLHSLREAMPDAPLFVEVPDLNWIVQNDAFWDFCYEHCNYFTPQSLRHALTKASFNVLDQQTSFGDQYQWALSVPGEGEATAASNGQHEAQRLIDYAGREAARLADAAAQARAAEGVVLWGMATKGVLLSMLLGPDLVRGGIDLNAAKQGRFAAGSGTAIHPPSWLSDLDGSPTIIAMNPNYLDEIRIAATAIRPDATTKIA